MDNWIQVLSQLRNVYIRVRLKSQLRTLLAEVVKCLQCKDLQPGQKQEASQVPI